MSYTYLVNGQEVEFDKEPTVDDIDYAASQIPKIESQKSEGVVEGTLKPFLRGLVETGAGTLDALEGLNKSLNIVKSGQEGIFGKQARVARESLDSPELSRGEISGGIPGRVTENITNLIGTGGQFEIAGAGNAVLGATTLGVLQGGESISDKIKAASMNNLYLGGFKAISTLPLIPRILASASAFGVPTMASNGDPTQTQADFLTGALIGGASRNAIEKDASVKVEKKPPTIIKDVETAKQVVKSDPQNMIRSVTASLGEGLKPIIAKAMSLFSSISEGYSRDLLDHPEYANSKYVKKLEKETVSEYNKVIQPLVKDTANRVKITDELKKGVQDLNLFVESKREPGPQDRMFKAIAEQTGGKVPREFLSPEEAKLKVPYGSEPTSRLQGLSEAERSKVLGWVEILTQKNDMSFNQANAMIAEMDATSQLQKRYKEVSKYQNNQEAPPSTQFVSIASTMRRMVSAELKSQYGEAARVIDDFSQMANARNVNRAFSKINPHLFNRLMFTVGVRALGIPIPPGFEFGVLAATSPKAQASIIRSAAGIGEAIRASVDPKLQFSGSGNLRGRLLRGNRT
jgi:hypothetical protein